MKNTAYPVNSFRFWKAFGVHMRPYLLFISGVAGLAGMSLAPGLPSMNLTSISLFMVFFLGYGFGQALTDSFQIDTDKISAPYRPLSRGLVRSTDVRWVALTGLVLSSLIMIWHNYWNILWGLLTIFGLATYTFFKRNYWLAGPPYNASIVALLPLMGFISLSGRTYLNLAVPVLWMVMLLSFCAYAIFVLMGYLKDIRADEASGYHTFTVKFGWNASVWVSDLLALISVFLTWQLIGYRMPAMLFGLAGTLIIIWGQLYAHLIREKVESNAAFPIAMTVRAFLLWHLAVVVDRSPTCWLFALLYYLAFELVFRLRPMREQI